MEFGCCPDIEIPLVKCSTGGGREFPECCTRYQQKVFAVKRERQRERHHRGLAARCIKNMAATEEATSEGYVATKANITRISNEGSLSFEETGISNEGSISFEEGLKHVHFGDEVVVRECPTDRLYRDDTNESAMDMIEAYKKECNSMKVKPINKVLEQLAKLDKLSTPIDTLDLKSCRLDNRSCEALEAVLSRMHMSTLDMERTGLEDDGMIALCEMVEFYQCATRLNFTGNPKLRARAWFFLGKMLKKVDFVEMVDVRQCSLDEQALTSMLRALRANCTLSILHLEGNNLSGKGIFILMAAMKFNENLKELYLGSNRILPEDCQNIGNILRTNHTLIHLDLRDNSIQNAGLRCVCAGIAEQQTGLLSLNLATNGISPEGMHHIAVMLPCTKSLQDINLSNNRVGDYGMMMSKLSLLANRSLLKLTLCNSRITCEGAIALAEYVAESKTLEQLDLRDNDIRIAGLLALALAYKMNYKLYRLTMPRTIKIDPRDKEMARGLMDNIDEYTTRNLNELQKRKKQQEKDAAEAAAIAAAALLEQEDEPPPPRTAAELEEEKRLISALENQSPEPAEDPFRDADIVSNPDAKPGKNLEKALDSLIMITKKNESANDDDVSPNDESLDDQASSDQQLQPKSLTFDLLSGGGSSVEDNTAPLIELSPLQSDPIRTDAVTESPTLPDLVGESPPKNQPLLEPVVVKRSQDIDASTLQMGTEISITTPDLVLGDNSTGPEMPLDIASNVSYPPLDLLTNEEASSQLVDVTQGTPNDDNLLSLSEDTTPTPDVSQVGQSQLTGRAIDLVDGHSTSVFDPLHTDTGSRNSDDNGPVGNEPL